MHKPIRTLVSASVLGILAASAAHSAGFALYGEGAGYATGNYAAGSAAEAGDASTGWYNPAGLILIHDQQLVFGGVGIFPDIKLSGSSTFNSPGLPVYTQNFTDVEQSNEAFVPSFHYALPLTNNVTFGLSVTSPYGLATNWQPDSPVRYAATYTEVLTTNISPELGVRLSDRFSVGAGVDVQWARVKFNSMVGAPTVDNLLFNNPMIDDSLSFNKGTSYGVGFHAGILGMFNDNHTRVGFNYQSRIRHTFYGFSRLTGPLASPGAITTTNPGTFFGNGMFSNGVDFPDVATLSAYQDVNDKLALLGSIVYTGWGVFNTIQLNGVAVPVISRALSVSQETANISIPQNYNDAWRVALGANYRFNERWMLRIGGGYDQTPTNDINRDVRLPDVDRWAIAAGARFQMLPSVSIDAGYTHLFGVNNNGVNNTEEIGSSSYTVDVASSTSADLVGLQLNWSIDQPKPAPMK